MPILDATRPAMKDSFRIGTRGSRLALVQANMVADGLRAAHPGLQVEIVEIRTSGDWIPAQGETRLSEAAGGKGQFAKEIETALLNGEIDCGVHSVKDMPSFLPDGLAMEHMLPREDARDAFLANGYANLDLLPKGAIVGTSSLRRQAFLLARRPDLKIVPIRGNVPKRIEKLREGRVDATLLALAGLRRLGLEQEAACVVDTRCMLPACGQGAVGIEIRAQDRATQDLLDPLHHRRTGLCIAAERAALQVLNGSCHTPIGAYATLMQSGLLDLHVAVASPDGTQFFEAGQSGVVSTDSDARVLGVAVGHDLKARVPAQLLV
jgi:hydroxymethylbilane synthase